MPEMSSLTRSPLLSARVGGFDAALLLPIWRCFSRALPLVPRGRLVSVCVCVCSMYSHPCPLCFSDLRTGRPDHPGIQCASHTLSRSWERLVQAVMALAPFVKQFGPTCIEMHCVSSGVSTSSTFRRSVVPWCLHFGVRKAREPMTTSNLYQIVILHGWAGQYMSYKHDLIVPIRRQQFLIESIRQMISMQDDSRSSWAQSGAAATMGIALRSIIA